MAQSYRKFNLAVVGATGAVGEQLLSLLDIRNFPIHELKLFASPQSISRSVLFKGVSIPIETLKPDSFQHTDLVFFAAGKAVSLKYVPQAVAQGCWVIDGSSAFRQQLSVPLIIPEINLSLLSDRNEKLIASPNCITTLLWLPLFPLHKRFNLKRIVMSTYQAASGAGKKVMTGLQKETEAFLNQTLVEPLLFPFPYAFNLFLHNSSTNPSTQYNEEEEKIIQESRKILNDTSLKMTVTCVRVPVMRAHSVAINAEFHEPITASMAHAILNATTGITVIEDEERKRFPMPIEASGKHNLLVGRIRNDLSNPNTIELWVVGDQLLKGSALNLIQIAEGIITNEKVSEKLGLET